MSAVDGGVGINGGGRGQSMRIRRETDQGPDDDRLVVEGREEGHVPPKSLL